MTDKELVEISKTAQKYAYAPYSDFRVGAALLCADGTVYTGCNIENASYGATICAERCAIFKAISEGKRNFVKIAITADKKDFVMPCGICRQVLDEFMPDGEVIVASECEIKKYTVRELMPYGFSM